MSSPSAPKKAPGRLAGPNRPFVLLLVGIAVTPVDHFVGTHIVIVSLMIITHKYFK